MWKPTTMAIRLLLLLLAVSTVRGTAAAARDSPSWCVCRPDASDAALQSTLDYACGKGGVDCRPLHSGGQCHGHGPDKLRAHCSYAANSYFHRISQDDEHATCDFGGAATLSEIDPSSETCKYPATAAAPTNGALASPPDARKEPAAWCVCKPGLSDAALQGTLDYACGHGADCEALRPGGECHVPNTLLAHCSYAANSYFQSNKDAACDFAGTATLSSTDPSSGTCKYAATDDAMSPAVGKMPLWFLWICLMGFSVYVVVLCSECRSSMRLVVSDHAAVRQEYRRAEFSGGAAVERQSRRPLISGRAAVGQQSRRVEVSGGAAVEQETRTAAAAAAAAEEERPIPDACSVCFEAWTNLGPHRICCIPCGHVYGRSCLETWLRQRGNAIAACPKCKRSFRLEDIINLYGAEVSS